MPHNTINSMRGEIDEIDAKLVKLFSMRMDRCKTIADIKRENAIALVDETREQRVIDSAVSMVDDELRDEVTAFMRHVMSLSKSYQSKFLYKADS